MSQDCLKRPSVFTLTTTYPSHVGMISFSLPEKILEMNDYLITLCLLTFYATVIHLSSGALIDLQTPINTVKCNRQSLSSGFFLGELLPLLFSSKLD